MEMLERCPFCGHTAEIVVGEHMFVDAKIRCTSCFAEGPIFETADDEKKNVDDAIIHWNTRTL